MKLRSENWTIPVSLIGNLVVPFNGLAERVIGIYKEIFELTEILNVTFENHQRKSNQKKSKTYNPLAQKDVYVGSENDQKVG